MKKKYNPFKMWGSWIGFFISYTFTYYKLLGITTVSIKNIISSFSFNEGYIAPLGLVTIIMTTIGFLTGWGIHSLFRRLK